MRKRIRLTVSVIAALLLLSSVVLGQENAKKRFGNADVVALVKAGLGDSVVIAKIKQAPDVDFKLETDDLVRLKAAGASPDVISAMLARATSTFDNTARPKAAPGLGKTGTIVLVTNVARREISPSIGEFSQTGFSFVKFSFLNYPGLGAKIRTDDRRPSVLVNSEFDPSQHYYIVKLDVDTKINARSLKIEGKATAFSESAGIRPASHWMLDYSSNEDEEGVWRITPKADLEPGEYGVFDGMQLFGFGIGPASTK